MPERRAGRFRSGGITWVCESPGSRWITSDAGGWSLCYTDGPSWWLMGQGAELDLSTRSFREAARRAAEEVEQRRGDRPRTNPTPDGGNTQ